jgi:hypothetical protein
MRQTLQHAVIPRRTLLPGPAIAGLALAIPLGIGARAAAPQSVHTHRVAAAVLRGPAYPAAVAQPAMAPSAPVATIPAAPRVTPHIRTAVPAHGGAPGGECNGALVTATLMPFSEHMNHAHFQRSPQQQASDIADADTYTKTHTVLVQNMSQPGRDDLFAISDGSMTPFVQHMYHAHFERSPMQQADDVAQADQYVKLHTVLAEHMLAPTLTAVSGDC